MTLRSYAAAGVLVLVALLAGGPARILPAADGTAEASPGQIAPRVDIDGNPVPAGALTRLGTTRFRILGTTTIALAAGGREVLANSGAGIHYWETHSGRLLRTLDTDGRTIVDFSASPDGKWGATLESKFDPESGSHSDSLQVWDLAAGKEVFSSQLLGGRGNRRLAVAPDGATVVTCQEDGGVSVWDVAGRAVILTERLSEGRLGSMLFSADGKCLVLSGRDSIWLWDWASGTPPRKIVAGERRLESFAVASDGRMLAVIRSGRAIAVRDLPAGRVLRRLESPEPRGNIVLDVAFSPDGRQLAAVCYWHRTIDIWETASGQRIARLPVPGDIPRRLVFSPDARWLAAAGAGNSIHLWDLATGKPLPDEPPGHRDEVRRLVFLGQTQFLATAGIDGTLRVWDTQTGRQQWERAHGRDDPRGGSAWVAGMAVSPDGKLIASSSLDDTVRVWESTTGREIYCLPGHGIAGGQRELAFTADRRLHSWGDDMLLRTWDLRTGKALAEWSVRPDGIEISDDDEARFDLVDKASVSRDGRWLVLKKQSFHVFDPDEGKQVAKIAGNEESGIGFAVSPDGKWFLANAFGHRAQTTLPDGRIQATPVPPTVRLYDRAAGKAVWEGTLPVHAGAGPLAFSPDGRVFAEATQIPPAEIRVWDAVTRQERAKFAPIPAVVAGLAFSGDNRLIAAGLRDGTVLVWEIPAPATKGEMEGDAS